MMGKVHLNNKSPLTRGLAELNCHMQDEDRDIRGGITGEGQELSQEDESQINEDANNRRRIESVLAPVCIDGGIQRLHQHPVDSLVRWERFLPCKSLKVLLVENDDSTRRVMSALLRNCGYEVSAVENGMQAWKMLENLTSQVHLVLTEVVMPCLSGIGLLSKIMGHKTCKNIPVIMMSSHDSVSIVFQCLSKGAVDFLVKPIRRNELKNIWQHIWRKCQTSSGSGSGNESGIHARKHSKSRSNEESDNNIGNNDDDDIGSIDLNIRDGSDHGSDTQSSWMKSAIEINSPQMILSQDKLIDPPDSISALVIQPRPEAYGSNWVPKTSKRECKRQDDGLGKDLELGISRTPNLQLPELSKHKVSEMKETKNDKQMKNGQLQLPEKLKGKEKDQVIDLTSVTEPLIESAVFDFSNSLCKNSSNKDDVSYDNKELPSIELSLKRLRDTGDIGSNGHQRNVLRHSDISAFSRYDSAANQASIGNVGSCSPLDDSSEAEKIESKQNSQSNSNSTPPNQSSDGSSKNMDIGSTINNISTKPLPNNDNSDPKATINCLQPFSAFQSVQNGSTPFCKPMEEGKADTDTDTDTGLVNKDRAQGGGTNQPVQVQHHHHHHHYYHHHVHNIPQKLELSDCDDLSTEKLAAAAPGSSNILGTPKKGHACNHGITGIMKESNHESDGQHGSSNSSNPNGSNIESGLTGKWLGSGGVGFGNKSVVDQDRFAQREAALNKFREKRKGRCFEKKVRYQSRKKLAEQRSRVRGQFVRQVVLHEGKGKDVHS